MKLSQTFPFFTLFSGPPQVPLHSGTAGSHVSVLKHKSYGIASSLKLPDGLPPHLGNSPQPCGPGSSGIFRSPLASTCRSGSSLSVLPLDSGPLLGLPPGRPSSSVALVFLPPAPPPPERPPWPRLGGVPLTAAPQRLTLVPLHPQVLALHLCEHGSEAALFSCPRRLARLAPSGPDSHDSVVHAAGLACFPTAAPQPLPGPKPQTCRHLPSE